MFSLSMPKTWAQALKILESLSPSTYNIKGDSLTWVISRLLTSDNAVIILGVASIRSGFAFRTEIMAVGFTPFKYDAHDHSDH